MSDTILDDVQALLEKELGDKRILEQIQRAAQNNEVISNFERNYVRKLAEKHLGKKPTVEKKIEKPKAIPDVQIPASPKPQPVQTFSAPTKTTKPTSKNTKFVLGAGIAALVVIIAAAVSLGGDSGISTTPVISDTPEIIKETSSQSFSIQTDLSSYYRGDIISISGNSELSAGDPVNLMIKNSDDETVWSEQVSAKSNGDFSTLTFAGGSGWKSGTFTIIAEINSEETTNTFSFNQ